MNLASRASRTVPPSHSPSPSSKSARVSVTYWPLTYPPVRDFVSRMHLCKQRSCRNESRTGRKTRRRWKHYIGTQFHTPENGRSVRRSEKSEQKPLWAWPWVSLQWEMALISPVNEVQSGTLDRGSQRVFRYGVIYNSPSVLPLYLSYRISTLS